MEYYIISERGDIVVKEIDYTKMKRPKSNKERVMCPICGKFLVPYLINSDCCQNCYRKILSEYSFWKYDDYKIKPKIGTTEYKVCEIMIKENINPKGVIEIYGKELGITSVKYVYNICEKYLAHCDTLGRQRPNIFK